MVPDGSKEGREASRSGDVGRDALIDWLERQAYGNEDGDSRVLRSDRDAWERAQAANE